MMSSFRTLDKKFRKACLQIRMLNRHIEEIQIRYDRAFSSGRRSFRYTHRLKLATYEGMRNMYYEYACRRADELEQMQDTLISRGLISDGESESESDMDCWRFHRTNGSFQNLISYENVSKIPMCCVLIICTESLKRKKIRKTKQAIKHLRERKHQTLSKPNTTTIQTNNTKLCTCYNVCIGWSNKLRKLKTN